MSLTAAREAIRRGHRAREAGRAEEALRWFRTAAEQAPGDAESQGLLGLMLLRMGRLAESAAPLEQAVRLAPGELAPRMHLSELCAREGDLPRALLLAREAAAKHPSDWWPQEREGELHAAGGDFAAAHECFRRACALRPGDPSLLYKLARAAFDGGDIDASQSTLAAASRLAPGQPAILALQAEILLRRADWEALERHASDWLLRVPQEPVALRHLARSQWARGFFKAGIASLEAALAAQAAHGSGPSPRPGDGRDAETLATLARLHLAVLDYEAAERALARSETIDPDCTHMLSTRAILAMYRGDFALAEQSARRSLALDPRDAAAWKVLVQLRGGRVDTADAASIARLEADDSVPPRDRATLAYALGDCLDAQGETDAAFAAWSRANARSAGLARAEGLRYDAPTREREIDAIIRRFSAAPAVDDTVHAPAVPVFIVGLPRSGTTLLEAALGAHSRVLACGERAAMRSIMQECMALPDLPGDATFARWREDYWRELPELGHALAITDKNPWNVDAIGLILQLFPQARILHLSRDPRETGLSIFRNEFPKFATFATRLEDIAHYAAQQGRLIGHWSRILSGRFLALRHEEVVADIEGSLRRVLDFCGLDWEARCLDFRDDPRPVATMSAVQVRAAPGALALRARRYAAHLGPLLASGSVPARDSPQAELPASTM